jgi:peptidyl-prolyl cis-trans isomerase A (cyclophilin A)
MKNSWLGWRSVSKWLALAAIASSLVACGGGSTKSGQPAVNATVEFVDTPTFGQLSTFRITGSNLRTAFVTIDSFNADRCTNLREILKTNAEVIFECIPNRLSVQFDVININGEDVKSVFATIPEPNIKFNALNTATTPKLGATVRFNIDGDQLLFTLAAPKSDTCFAIEGISISRTRYVLECIPTALNVDFTLTTLNGREVGTKTITLPSNTEVVPLTLTANTTPILNGTTPTVFLTNGYLGGSAKPKVSVSDSQCASISYLRQTAAELVFSCTPKVSTVLFDIKTDADALIETLPMPVKKVRFDTSLGSFDVALDAENAPITVKNFLIYVNQSYYSSTIFHRVVAGFVNQGGGFTTQANLLSGTQKPGLRAPIKLESTNISGLSNTLNTIAMARTTDPNSATSQFFINTVDNTSSLDYKSADEPGYAVFGAVVSGDTVIETINNVSTATLFGNQGVPVTDIVINSVTPVVGTNGEL